MHSSKILALFGLGLSLSLAACSGGEAAPAPDAEASTAAVEVSAAPEATPVATAAAGNVIEVKLITDAQGNRFEPAEITAKVGDVIRFVNESGVHNVSFPASQNANAASLPAASPYMQAPGQTFELKVDLAAGSYTFQCDPHAALGMIGTLTVQ